MRGGGIKRPTMRWLKQLREFENSTHASVHTQRRTRPCLRLSTTIEAFL